MEDDKQHRAERDASAADEGKDEGTTAEVPAKAGPSDHGRTDGSKDASKSASKGESKGMTRDAAKAGAKAGAKGSPKDQPKGKKSTQRRGRNAKGARAQRARAIDHVRVADGALRSIIGLAAHEVPGVVGMAPVNIGEGLRRILGARQVDEGVSVEHPHGEDRADVDIHVVVAYGVNIPVVAGGVRERVRYAARQFAGVTLDEVRVHVEGVSRG